METTAHNILHAAGRQFADSGRYGASIRGIVEAAGASLSAVNYHFGGKDGLYEAAVAHALGEGTGLPGLFGGLEQPPAGTPAALAGAVSSLIGNLLRAFIPEEGPRWPGRLAARAFCSADGGETPCPEVLDTLEKGLRALLGPHGDGLDAGELRWWLVSLLGEAAFLTLSEPAVARAFGRPAYDAAFVDVLGHRLAAMWVPLLGLPAPDAAPETLLAPETPPAAAPDEPPAPAETPPGSRPKPPKPKSGGAIPDWF